MSTDAVTPLRHRMIEDMNARKLCAGTQRGHVRSCKRFAAFLNRSPDTATTEDIRRFQLHLAEAGMSICNRNRIMTGLRFLFRVTLRRLDLANAVYHIREPQKIPLVISPDETRRLLAVASNLKVRTLHQEGRAMDYDRTEIATSYDQARALMPETARLWLDLIAAQVGRSTSLIVDLGCGTGRFSDLLAAHFGVQVIGFDPSQKMIDQARRKPTTDTVSYRHGAAEATPLSDGSADLVFMSNVYHHLSNPIAAARECRRILRSGGRVCLRNGTCELDFPYRHFFPGLDSLINSEMPSQGDIEETFVRAGFARSLHQVIRQVVAPDWQGFVDKMRLRADSFLARLSDKDFEQGMIALQSPDSTIDQRGVVTEEIGWFVFARLG